MMSVFLVQHSYEIDDCEETKTIGIYSTKEKAEETIEKFKKIQGFKDYPDCFFIDEYMVDKDHWTEGFIKCE
jgi:hypothetical protein